MSGEKMTSAEVRAAAPVTPPCFNDQEAWQDYLHDSQETGKRASARPFYVKTRTPALVVEFRKGFNFCRDCDAKHAQAMEAAGRCNPNHYGGRS